MYIAYIFDRLWAPELNNFYQKIDIKETYQNVINHFHFFWIKQIQ